MTESTSSAAFSIGTETLPESAPEEQYHSVVCEISSALTMLMGIRALAPELDLITSASQVASRRCLSYHRRADPQDTSLLAFGSMNDLEDYLVSAG
jgi:hypothetical protein